jgi:hypothetical protein
LIEINRGRGHGGDRVLTFRRRNKPMSKFGALTGDISRTARIPLTDPASERALPIKDHDGKEAYIEVEYVDSEAGRSFDRMQAQSPRTPDEQVTRNKHKTARLTRSWYLVDPGTGEPIDVTCNEESARELYCDESKIAHHIWLQVWIGANALSNFTKRGSAISSFTLSTNSANPTN